MGKADTFSVNDRVTNPTFGEGTIRGVDERYTTVEFDENGTRRFVTSLVKLERSDSQPPPPKPARTKKGGR